MHDTAFLMLNFIIYLSAQTKTFVDLPEVFDGQQQLILDQLSVTVL